MTECTSFKPQHLWQRQEQERIRLEELAAEEALAAAEEALADKVLRPLRLLGSFRVVSVRWQSLASRSCCHVFATPSLKQQSH